MAYGITPTGFNRKDLSAIKAELEASWVSIFGSSINLAPQSPDGQIIGVFAAMLADVWAVAQESYDAFNPSAARGALLSNLVQINGITRIGASSSEAVLTLTGTNGTVIPLGSRVSTGTVEFATTAAATISGGTATVTAAAVIAGPTPALAGTIQQIITPVSGWLTVNNAADAVLGRDAETDAALRRRRVLSVAYAGTSMYDSLAAGLAALTTRYKLYENATSTTDADGNAPHSIRAVVEGGLDADIAESIYERKAAGIGTNGAESVDVIGADGSAHTILFDRVALAPVKIIVNRTTYAGYPVNGDELIKQAIVDYFASQLADGTDYGIGDDVVSSRLYVPVHSVPGVRITSILIAFDPTTPVSSADLVVSNLQRAVTDITKITVA